MSVQERVQNLRTLIRLLVDASEVVIKEWEAEERASPGTLDDISNTYIPSAALFNARRTVVGACGMCADLVQDPRYRLMEIGISFYASRAMRIVCDARIADILADVGSEGMSIYNISKQTGIDEHKLARILRCLCSMHIFVEVKPKHFANSRTSQHLRNDGLRCWVLIHGMEVYTASDKLPAVFYNPSRTHSNSPKDSAFCDAFGTDFWEYMEQGEKQPDGSVKPKPGLDLFARAMVGGGRVAAPPLYVDYPWGDLGAATVVDVGGGVGGMSLDLAKMYPKLNFVVEDRPAVIKKASAVWQAELPKALEDNRVQLLAHDFFTEQPIKCAEVYIMRYILHDWPDAECIAILSQLRKSMGPSSRILSVDTMLNTTLGSPLVNRAPPPLPANYGVEHQLTHSRDLNMLTLLNGMERTPEDMSILAEKAGLKVEKVWECRSSLAITEMRLAA
ncbi:S-adenosyl-L-methionine-dependent methyltransferase [Obba rivulosa]|uniref:S-adenosyl-L-methionine-dependent methyltransferase n=1 Tax=Obba rivulosa TaxID=1052685 RepID=A0A8E2DLC6_9APHY|nr:S-adenosyl-L-methionine-dependent methyltransferase [Obba rivulosa]